MVTPPLNPEKRAGKAGPLFTFIVAGIIIVGILLFLIMRPNPSGYTHPSSTEPTSQR